MTDTDLESFSPRNAIILLSSSGNSETWSAFTVGHKNVKRITVNDYGLVRVEFENGRELRAVASDWSGWVATKPAPVAAIPPPKPAPQPMQKQGARR